MEAEEIFEPNPEEDFSKVEAEATVYQISYNIGGATAGLHVVDTDNSDFVSGKTETKSIFALSMAF